MECRSSASRGWLYRRVEGCDGGAASCHERICRTCAPSLCDPHRSARCLDAAFAGDILEIGDDTYLEAVSVDKGLTLRVPSGTAQMWSLLTSTSDATVTLSGQFSVDDGNISINDLISIDDPTNLMDKSLTNTAAGGVI